MRRGWGLPVAAALAACCVAAPNALAQGAPPSVWQYVETIPSGEGVREAPVGSIDADVAPALRDALVQDGGSDFTALLQIVSSPSFGAPRAGFAERGDAGTVGAAPLEGRVPFLALALVVLTALLVASRARDR